MKDNCTKIQKMGSISLLSARTTTPNSTRNISDINQSLFNKTIDVKRDSNID